MWWELDADADESTGRNLVRTVREQLGQLEQRENELQYPGSSESVPGYTDARIRQPPCWNVGSIKIHARVKRVTGTGILLLESNEIENEVQRAPSEPHCTETEHAVKDERLRSAQSLPTHKVWVERPRGVLGKVVLHPVGEERG